ncbi:TetR/AcrR family transcriptional regulator [Xanthomonas theicola]|uniref:TetR family transcriptional regulator n=1 Tax=Xanthomonas theicola TaxID=56464 RepID=A0A2S6ZDB3_9XANT|nr:TetR/AcrR family transcriptional regulator [Xanthomonas theicola]PPT90275.1 TetR family transcriptional regulator [Xanthomonas theicola]QNH26211.1 TetR/AcrR family transcriptional regulator [Xanthomonas theicola]
MVTLSDLSPAQSALLDATERLVYAGGIHATGMDAIVNASGVARKTLYRHYSTKEALVEAALLRRDARWMRWFVAATSASDDPVERLLSCFDALRDWFGSSDFHGCAFLNAAGEIGDPGSRIRAVSHGHKRCLRDYLLELVTATGHPDSSELAEQFLILIDGAISVVLVLGGANAAGSAKHAARRFLGLPSLDTKP